MATHPARTALRFCIAEIDDQHGLQLFLLGGLLRALAAGHRQGAYRLLDRLEEVTHAHFQAEQQLMTILDYPFVEAHGETHARLVEELGALRGRIADLPEGAAPEVVESFERLLTEHSETADRALGVFLRASFGGRNAERDGSLPGLPADAGLSAACG